jgi:hypothetical protein
MPVGSLGAVSPDQEPAAMSEWMAIERWSDCAGLARPGTVFEVQNAEGQRMLTPCVLPLQVPFDWRSPPVRFRAVVGPPAQRSAPIPPPKTS